MRRTQRTFDRVIIDLPDPHNESLNKLYCVEFYRLLRRCMAPDGLMVTQSSSPLITREVFWSIAATIAAAGMQTHSYHVTIPSFGPWGFTIGAVAGTAPTSFDIRVPTSFLTGQVMAQASTFGKDVGPMEAPVNTLMEPRLYLLYLKGVKR